jgi:hypothetical protein
MHRESVYLCTYTQGAQKLVGRVRAWDVREAAQLFAAELEAESDGRRIVPRDIQATKTPLPRFMKAVRRRTR